MWTGWAPYAIIAFYCFITFMVAVLAWSRGYNKGNYDGFNRGYEVCRNGGRAVELVNNSYDINNRFNNGD